MCIPTTSKQYPQPKTPEELPEETKRKDSVARGNGISITVLQQAEEKERKEREKVNVLEDSFR